MPRALLFDASDFAEGQTPQRIDYILDAIRARLPLGDVDFVDEPLGDFVRNKENRCEPADLMECVR